MTGPTVADIAATLKQHQPNAMNSGCTCGLPILDVTTMRAWNETFRQHQADVLAPDLNNAEVDAAIDTMARAVIWDLVRDQAGDADLWATYPDISEADFAAVMHRATQLALGQAPSNDDRAAAYSLLHDRADGGEA